MLTEIAWSASHEADEKPKIQAAPSTQAVMRWLRQGLKTLHRATRRLDSESMRQVDRRFPPEAFRGQRGWWCPKSRWKARPQVPKGDHDWGEMHAACMLLGDDGVGRLRVLIFCVLWCPANGCRRIEPGLVRDGLHADRICPALPRHQGKVAHFGIPERARSRELPLAFRPAVRSLAAWMTKRVQVSPCGYPRRDMSLGVLAFALPSRQRANGDRCRPPRGIGGLSLGSLSVALLTYRPWETNVAVVSWSAVALWSALR